MINTNDIVQAGQVAQQVKETISPWIPFLTTLGVLVGRELSNLGNWADRNLERVIAHGGIVNIIWKILWNKGS